MNQVIGGRGITRNSGGYTVQVWPLPMMKNTKKSLDNGKKKHRLEGDTNVVLGKEKTMEFEGRDGLTYVAAFFKRAGIWNVHVITRKIVVSNVSGNPNGILESKSE